MKRCNKVLHLAALIGIPYSYVSPLAYIRTNVEGTYNILECSKNLNIDDIVISAGSTTGTVSFTPTDDSLYDATSNETATIAISGVSGGGASESGTQTVTITITDNESAPTVTLATSGTSIAENSTSTLTLTAT